MKRFRCESHCYEINGLQSILEFFMKYKKMLHFFILGIYFLKIYVLFLLFV